MMRGGRRRKETEKRSEAVIIRVGVSDWFGLETAHPPRLYCYIAAH